MPEDAMQIVLNTTVTKRCDIRAELDIARRSGHAGVETTERKVRDFLDTGHTSDELRSLLDGLEVYGIGTVIDIERHGEDLSSLKKDAERVFEAACLVDAKAIQIINGPLKFEAVVEFEAAGSTSMYSGVLGYPGEEQIAITARNLRMLADMGRERGLTVYLEALAWSPVRTLDQQRMVLERVDRDNLKIVVDFWHLATAGTKPEDLAGFDPRWFYGVHVCDGLRHAGGVPDESVLRDVPTGQGALDVQAWVDAVVATGYDGWWTSETFCRAQHDQDNLTLARELRAQLVAFVERAKRARSRD